MKSKLWPKAVVVVVVFVPLVVAVVAAVVPVVVAVVTVESSWRFDVLLAIRRG